ncbi:MAG: SpoIIE family protein phosphatase [Terriglobia bacterium]|jgi:sigma-B regulation protein RsbU (phosphoserine phosphatase)
MARFAVWVAAYGAALRVVDAFTAGAPGILWFVFWVAAIVIVVHYLRRLSRYIRQRVLWRVRRRLIVTYFFIAVVPILLILLLVGLGAYIISGQFGAYLVALKVSSHVDELQELAQVVAHEAHLTGQPTAARQLDHLQKFFVSELHHHQEAYPALEVTLQTDGLARAFRIDGTPIASPVTIPEWLEKRNFAGIVLDQDEILLRAVDRSRTPAGELTIILSQPITPELLDSVGADVGPVGLLLPLRETPAHVPQTPAQPTHLVLDTGQKKTEMTVRVQSKSIRAPAPMNRLDLQVVGASTLDPVIWGGTERRDEPTAGIIYMTSRMLTLDRKFLATLGQLSLVYVWLFATVAVTFLVLELFALVIGVQLTRSITATVDKLHRATERVKVGDFSYRIAMLARDQLSALGESFDGMTASVERLLRESLEKTRLEGELEIAREVQSQLFPQEVPEVPGLRLYGACKPARVVSGDYYDFLRLSDSRVDLVVGDISGKGISAALLMASIQSALHSQFYNGLAPGKTSDTVSMSSADVVGRLNRQLFASTPQEKYATFFYAAYDSVTRRLIYTNAGHPPPFYFHRGKVERLTAGGTVVGLMGLATYEQAVVQLEPGDMILAYTDGMTEPENSYGEEFGEARLLEVAQRAAQSAPADLVAELYGAVGDWTGSPELQDDMTLVVARAV